MIGIDQVFKAHENTCGIEACGIRISRSSMEKVVSLEQSLDAVAAFTGPEKFFCVRRHINPTWVQEVLEPTGTATVRKRGLPAEQVVWPVIGMAMFRKWPIHPALFTAGWFRRRSHGTGVI